LLNNSKTVSELPLVFRTGAGKIDNCKQMRHEAGSKSKRHLELVTPQADANV
jgi:hypothetical protein